jgi:RHS repeat-associated protein
MKELQSEVGKAGVLGTAVASSTVSITGTIPSVTGTVARTADNWWGVLDYSSASIPSDWKIDEWTATATLSGAGIGGSNAVAEESGIVELPPASRSPNYDLDGNTTFDGRFNYTWDLENRLVVIQTGTAAESAGVTPLKVECAYDWQGRRVKKLVYRKPAGSWVLESTIGFGYDGWNLVCETGTIGDASKTHPWGLDMSNTWQGAGGIGGLLLTKSSSAAYVLTFDGIGNVMGMVNAATGALRTSYEYGPFGEVLRATGIAANENSFGFSTKYSEEPLGLLYFGYRYYSLTLGRWLSRDPIEEKGGINLAAAFQNSPTNVCDSLGLDFIAVGANSIRFANITLPFSHLIVQRWKSLCPLLKSELGTWTTKTKLAARLAARKHPLSGMQAAMDLFPDRGKKWKVDVTSDSRSHGLGQNPL